MNPRMRPPLGLVFSFLMKLRLPQSMFDDRLLRNVGGAGLFLQLALGLTLFDELPTVLRDAVLFFGAGAPVYLCVAALLYRETMRWNFYMPEWMEPCFPLRGRWLQRVEALAAALLFAGLFEMGVLGAVAAIKPGIAIHLMMLF